MILPWLSNTAEYITSLHHDHTDPDAEPFETHRRLYRNKIKDIKLSKKQLMICSAWLVKHFVVCMRDCADHWHRQGSLGGSNWTLAYWVCFSGCDAYYRSSFSFAGGVVDKADTFTHNIGATKYQRTSLCNDNEIRSSTRVTQCIYYHQSRLCRPVWNRIWPKLKCGWGSLEMDSLRYLKIA